MTHCLNIADITDSPVLDIHGLSKSFTLHTQGAAHLAVLKGISLRVAAGECVALAGPSGAGKSSLLRCIYGNYLADAGAIRVLHHGRMVDLAAAGPRHLLGLRQDTLGYVSQFLRVIPRVPTLDIVAATLPARTEAELEAARCAARVLLLRLNIPAHMHGLSPLTFSGGEQQRVNIARGFIRSRPVMLLDEPTASLDSVNRDVVVELILEAKARGTALVGIFHDEAVRDRVADRLLHLNPCEARA